MRNFLLILVLANVLYFMWDRYGDKAAEVGVAIVEESQLGPPLSVASRSGFARQNPNSAPNPVGSAIIEAARTELTAATGQSCATVKFRQRPEASTALDDFEARGMTAGMRQAPGQVFIGHWVQIRDIPNREAGNEMILKLQDDGMFDVYLMEDEGNFRISLGLFSDIDRAERIELQANSLDLPATITPRMQDAMVYYVDVGLPPGRGAGAMIEQYGEDRVLLRGEASCPED